MYTTWFAKSYQTIEKISLTPAPLSIETSLLYHLLLHIPFSLTLFESVPLYAYSLFTILLGHFCVYSIHI
jgi:nitrate reductase gamma subunit